LIAGEEPGGGSLFGRVLNEARREQGFRSQEHLDAFYAYVDHSDGCGECGGEGKSCWNEADASWQPTVALCPRGRQLLDASSSLNFPEPAGRRGPPTAPGRRRAVPGRPAGAPPRTR
jgi:hypothetical protein